MNKQLRPNKIEKDVLTSVIAAALSNIEILKQVPMKDLRTEEDDYLHPDVIQDDHKSFKLPNFGALIKPSSFIKYSSQSSSSDSFSETSDSEDSIYAYLAVPNRTPLYREPSIYPPHNKDSETNFQPNAIKSILKKGKYQRYGKGGILNSV